MPFDKKRIISSTEALMLQEVPKHLVVVGGGYKVLELGTAYAKFGAKVTILEGSDTILSGTDSLIALRVWLQHTPEPAPIINKSTSIFIP